MVTSAEHAQPAADLLSKAEAIRRVKVVDRMLADLLVDVRVIGSLATGRFGPNSDVDFLVLKCPADLKYGIEGRIEECLKDLGFDVLYADELSPYWLGKALTHAVHARALG